MAKMLTWAVAGLFLGVLLLGAQDAARAQLDGKKLYNDKCGLCHGPKGDGKGSGAGAYNPPPTAFNTPKFWQEDVNKKTNESVTKGKEQMDPIKMSPEEIKAVVDYMTKTFKK
ncbi:MAG: cytochrome c [Deltaproteobacteria bacterium]|nr:cytochrome c [Deltaproteobacteria bacterium]